MGSQVKRYVEVLLEFNKWQRTCEVKDHAYEEKVDEFSDRLDALWYSMTPEEMKEVDDELVRQNK